MGIDVKTHGDDLFSAAAYDDSPARARSEARSLSGGAYFEFGDFANLMKVIEHVWLGGGEKARKLLGVSGTPTGVTKEVEIDSAALSFQDIALERNKG